MVSAKMKKRLTYSLFRNSTPPHFFPNLKTDKNTYLEEKWGKYSLRMLREVNGLDSPDEGRGEKRNKGGWSLSPLDLFGVKSPLLVYKGA